MAKRSTKLTKKRTEQSFFNGYEGKKVAKKNYKSGHTNDAKYSYPKGGHEIKNLPNSKLVRGA